MTDTAKILPSLRFPEFENDGEWNVMKLGEIAHVYQGYGFPEALQGKKHGKYPFYKVSDISNTVNQGLYKIDAAINYLDEDDLPLLNNAKLIPQGTIIFAKIGEAIRLNRRVITTKESLIDNNTAGVKAKNEKADDMFLYYIMTMIDLIKFAGGVVPAVKKSIIEDIIINIPNIPEQQKIAAFLTSLDEQISAHTKKLEALKAHKKGLMQQLFPANGEKTPKLRFPEFKNVGEWKEVRLGEIIKECKDVSKVENEDILLSSSIEGIFLNSELFSHQRGVSNIGYRKIKKGMLVLSAQNLHLGNANVNLKYEHGLVSPAYKIFDIVDCNALFVSHWIKKDSTKQLFFDSTTEGASVCRRNVVWNTLYNQTILMPLDSEQQKIASFLSSIDEMIQAQDDKIRKLKTYKNGLMQQMFAK